MGWLQDLATTVGEENLKRLSAGEGNFNAPDSPDQKNLEEMVAYAKPGQLRDVFSRAAQQENPQQYANHITPGAGGTNPLGTLGAGALGSIAAILMNQQQKSGSPLGQIPGLRTQNPNEMSPTDVAAMARYAQQNQPDAFGEAAFADRPATTRLAPQLFGEGGTGSGGGGSLIALHQAGPSLMRQ